MHTYGKQSINEDDIKAVADVLRSPFITQGPQVEAFEKALCDYTGARHCVVVSNGTAALHISVLALGLPAGSEGITTPMTFSASANAMLYGCIKPVFADIDPVTHCLDPKKAEEKLTARTRLMTPVHYAGRTCDMAALKGLADQHGLNVIEDAAHAIGSSYPCGAKVGSCKYADLTIFSFHPVKTITTGEGGAVLTNDRALYERLILFRSHGITKVPSLLEQNPGPWYYEMQELGFNYRMTDFQAALGISQLRRLDSFAARRRAIAHRYNEAFRSLPHFRTPSSIGNHSLCFHLYTACIDFAAIGKSRPEYMQELRNCGVGTQVHYIPVHLLPYYRKNLGFKRGDYPLAEAFYEQELSLPLYPDLTVDEVEKVIAAVFKCTKSA